MLIKEFISKFEEIIPVKLQDSWDNSGLQVGNLNEELRAVYTCVDLNQEVIDHAKKVGANLILCHHPILFRPTKEINYDNYISKKLISAIKSDIAIYASHTAIDINKEGLNPFVFKAMGFKSKGKIQEHLDGHGYGDVDHIPARKISHLADQIKERLDLDHIVFYGDEEYEVSDLGLVTGSGSSFIGLCIEHGLELFITADVKHHEAMDALEQGLMIMDIGHFQSEKLFNDLAKNIIKRIDNSLPVYSEIELEKYRRNII